MKARCDAYTGADETLPRFCGKLTTSDEGVMLTNESLALARQQ